VQKQEHRRYTGQARSVRIVTAALAAIVSVFAWVCVPLPVIAKAGANERLDGKPLCAFENVFVIDTQNQVQRPIFRGNVGSYFVIRDRFWEMPSKSDGTTSAYGECLPQQMLLIIKFDVLGVLPLSVLGYVRHDIRQPQAFHPRLSRRQAPLAGISAAVKSHNAILATAEIAVNGLDQHFDGAGL
jgi:hypothetical protein